MLRRSGAIAAAVLGPALAAVGRVAAGCVQVRNGAAAVSSGCAPADADRVPGHHPFVAVAADHAPPGTVYVPVYVPVYVQVQPAPAPAPAAAPAPVPADEPRNRDRNNDEPAPDEAPADASATLAVELDCEATPETIRVTNNGDAPVTVTSIDTIVEDVAGEPFVRDDTIRAGRTVTYQSGEGAEGRFVLGPNELFANDSRDEGVRLASSGGEIEALCFTS
jgi:hypothetical protein